MTSDDDGSRRREERPIFGKAIYGSLRGFKVTPLSTLCTLLSLTNDEWSNEERWEEKRKQPKTTDKKKVSTHTDTPPKWAKKRAIDDWANRNLNSSLRLPTTTTDHTKHTHFTQSTLREEKRKEEDLVRGKKLRKEKEKMMKMKMTDTIWVQKEKNLSYQTFTNWLQWWRKWIKI